jgi:predicted PurR-regulated permease PerM
METREPLDAPAPSAPNTVGRPTRRLRIAFTVLLALAVGLSLYVIWPFRAPLLLAAVLASVLHSVFRRASRLLHGHRALGAFATTVGLVVLILGPLAGIVAFAAGQVVKGLAFVHDELGIENVGQLHPGALPPRGQELLDHLLAVLHLSRAQVDHFAHQASLWAEGALQTVLASSSRATFHAAIMIVAFYFFLLEGSHLVGWVRRISPLEARQTRDLLDEFRSVSRASILGNAIAAVFQGVVTGIGFALFGVPHPIFFGLVTLIASFIPVVGTLVVWGPAIAFLAIAGHHGAAIGLAIWCLVLVAGGEHVGKPLVVRWVLHGQEEMHTGLVFLSLVGGLEMFGPIGLVLGPLVFSFLLAMLRMYERDFLGGELAAH